MTVDLAALKQANPLEAVVQRMTGQPIVRHKIRAPWRSDSMPSVHIYDDGKWHDFGTGQHGDVYDFVGMLLKNGSYDPAIHLSEVIDYLGGLDIKPLPAVTNKPKPEKPKLTLSMDTIATWHDTMPQQRRAYWRQRGLTEASIDRFLLGWDGKRYTIPALYRGIPFGVKRRQSDIDDGLEAKYVSITGSRVGIFNSDVLWTAQDAIICEGEIDCMLLCQAGYNAVTSTGGAGSWRDEWARFFAGVQRIYVLFDNDTPGRDGALKVRASLKRARIVEYPDGIKDAGELFTHKWAAEWLYNNVQ